MSDRTDKMGVLACGCGLEDTLRQLQRRALAERLAVRLHRPRFHHASAAVGAKDAGHAEAAVWEGREQLSPGRLVFKVGARSSDRRHARVTCMQ